MGAWWSGISAFERVFWYFAVPATLLFIFQTMMVFIGLDGHPEGGDLPDGGDLDGDQSLDHEVDHYGFHLITLRNIIIFFTAFGWTGIFGVHAGLGPVITVMIAFTIGVAMMFLVAGLFYFIARLTESGNINVRNAIDAGGTVYLPIPPQRSGRGQVQMVIQGSLREFDAMTDADGLPTGTPIRVKKVLGDRILLVEKER